MGQDYVESVKWYRKAADLGNTHAQAALGFSYEQGQGVPQDYAEAVKWYRRSAEAGHADAMTELGRCYGSGIGVARDDAEGLKGPGARQCRGGERA